MTYPFLVKLGVTVLSFLPSSSAYHQLLQVPRIPCSTSKVSHSWPHQSTQYIRQVQPAFLSKTSNHESALFSSAGDSEGASTESESEVERILFGWKLLVNGGAWGEPSSVRKLWTSLEDIVGVWGHVPLIIASFQTALTGKCNGLEYGISIFTILLMSLAHGKMTYDTPRDWRAPRLAEYRTVYEFSCKHGGFLL